MLKIIPQGWAAGYYRVRKSWRGRGKPVGAVPAFVQCHSEGRCQTGLFVFSNEGEVIHPELEIGMRIFRGKSRQREGAAETIDSPVDAGGDINTGDSAADDPIPEAVEYDCDGNDQPIAYARLSTLMNIRSGNSMDAEPVTTYKRTPLWRSCSSVRATGSVSAARKRDWFCLCERAGAVPLWHRQEGVHRRGEGQPVEDRGGADRLRYPVHRNPGAERPDLHVIRVGMKLVMP